MANSLIMKGGTFNMRGGGSRKAPAKPAQQRSLSNVSMAGRGGAQKAVPAGRMKAGAAMKGASGSLASFVRKSAMAPKPKAPAKPRPQASNGRNTGSKSTGGYGRVR
jgi:hypothetical protein